MSVKSKNTQCHILTSDIKYDPSQFRELREFYASNNAGKELSEKALCSRGFYMMEFMIQRMNHSMIKLGGTRRNIDAYPRRSLLEGVINAVAHRDYFFDGAKIQIDMVTVE